jgi:hypothetical protein
MPLYNNTLTRHACEPQVLMLLVGPWACGVCVCVGLCGCVGGVCRMARGPQVLAIAQEPQVRSLLPGVPACCCCLWVGGLARRTRDTPHRGKEPWSTPWKPHPPRGRAGNSKTMARRARDTPYVGKSRGARPGSMAWPSVSSGGAITAEHLKCLTKPQSRGGARSA